ncbi:MAG: dodecin family protein [Clostridia bacterium]|nr:dodecin family protein [Clostridia bacterium]
MSTVKVINLIGESDDSWEGAVKNAVSEAAKTLDNLIGVEVVNNTAKIEEGRIVKYKSNVHIAFRVKN